MAHSATLRQRLRLVTLAALACAAGVMAETVSFQNGFNGYNGTVQIRMTSGLGPGSTGGSLNDPDFVMCRKFVPNEAEGSVNFWRFDDMFGTGPGQIPPNATILSARFELRTCSNVTIPGLNPPLPHGTFVTSPGPVCLARMLVPVDEKRLTLQRPWGVDPNTNNYYAISSIVPAPNPPLIWVWYGAEGPDYAGGDYDRPVGGYIDMSVPDRVESADVTSIVQEWAGGAENHGFIMFADTTNYWVVEGTGHDYHYPSDLSRRPKLIVEFARTRTQPTTFQQDVGGYGGCSMLRVGQNGTSLLGSTIDVAGVNAYLDGGTGPADPEQDCLIKFDGIFGNGAGQVAPGAKIVKAFLVLTTPPLSNAADAHSDGPYRVHQMMVDADWTGTQHPGRPFLWSEFANADGPTLADGEIGPVLASAQAMTYDGRAWFDVTTAVQAWQYGDAPNYGLAIKPATTDGWKIHWTGPTSPPELRPQLIVMTAVYPAKPADFDNNTFVDGDDLNAFLGCASGPAVASAAGCEFADFDDDLDVDMVDFAAFQYCYSPAPIEAMPVCRPQVAPE